MLSLESAKTAKQRSTVERINSDSMTQSHTIT